MKIAVIGAGAIGSVIGGLLSKAGEDVTLIGRKPHVDAIIQTGLILEGESGRTVTKVKAAENLDFKPDLALLTVKAQDVEFSVRKVQLFLSGTQVVTMQNGVQSDDQVAGLLGKENIISSVVTFNGQFLESGKALYSIPFSKTALLIGEPFGNKGDRLQSISVLLNKALPTDIIEDIRAAHWTKLLWNLQTAIPAVTGLSYQENYQYPQVRKLVINLLKEGLKVIERARIKTVDVPGFPLEPLRTMARVPLRISSSMIKDKAKSLGNQPVLGSTLQSIKRGKSTEVDYLNGEIVNLGKKTSITTPTNSLMVGLVHQVETTRKFLTVDELTQRLSQNITLSGL
jgi:2-dehydropantoate 2-reductase